MEILKIKKGNFVVVNRDLIGKDLDLDRDDKLVDKGTIGKVLDPNPLKNFTTIQLRKNRKLVPLDVPAELLSPLNLITFFRFVIPGAIASLGLNRVRQKLDRVIH